MMISSLQKMLRLAGMVICIAVGSTMAKSPRIVVTVTNPSNIDRSNEMVVLQWNDLIRKCPSLIPSGVHIYNTKTKEETVDQIIDIDCDGIPEEVIFRAGVRAGETNKFLVTSSTKSKKSVQPLTDVLYALPREDMAWENDRIAFRIYGPALAKDVNNGIDVWTKRVRYPIIQKWYKGDEDTGTNRISYHEDHGEGADFFNVGKTLGAGSCALYRDDSLFQPGVYATHKIIAAGPLRAIFEVTYSPVRFGGILVSEVRRITLDAGSNLNTIEITYSSDSSAGVVSFAAGIVKRKGVVSALDSSQRWVSLWGPTNEDEANGSLGTGIVMAKNVFTGVKENDVHVLILGTAELGKPVKYYAGAGWTRTGDFSGSDEWNAYLKNFLRQIESPVTVSVSIVK
jgi:unsaturated rhamnogalacturonyl hydrolase